MPFQFFDAADLGVVVNTAGVPTTLVLGTGYTVTGGAGSTGSIVTTSAVPATSTVIITRNTAKTQLTSYTTGDRFPASAQEKALDKLTMIAQENSRLSLPSTATATGAAPYVLGVQAAGNTPAWVPQGGSTILDGSITTAKLATGAAIGNIADGAITTAKIDPAAKIGGATGAGTDRTFYENDQSVNTSYTISSGKNAMSAGPITIANGVTVTVPDGSTYTVV